ncbi:MAG: hypothetical protein A4E52_02151 [Pelotomaculum sp. PtaB.Bin013]|nr:MAG: hypothetical protein A4E52_02151 [Pelotomaculum sp. PtaB.Bin013]
MLAKGLAIRLPYIITASVKDFVKNQSFLTGFLGERRPLLAREVEHLYFNLFNNIIGKYLLTGFKQVASSEKVRSIMVRGINMADKFIESFGSTLKKENILIRELCLINGGSMRHDLAAKYTRIIAEAASFAEDSLNIMIENGWFEEPPRAIDRSELTELKH